MGDGATLFMMNINLHAQQFMMFIFVTDIGHGLGCAVLKVFYDD